MASVLDDACQLTQVVTHRALRRGLLVLYSGFQLDDELKENRDQGCRKMQTEAPIGYPGLVLLCKRPEVQLF